MAGVPAGDNCSQGPGILPAQRKMIITQQFDELASDAQQCKKRRKSIRGTALSSIFNLYSLFNSGLLDVSTVISCVLDSMQMVT